MPLSRYREVAPAALHRLPWLQIWRFEARQFRDPTLDEHDLCFKDPASRLDPAAMRQFEVLDSHTEGEPTRVVVSGLPSLSDRGARARADELGAAHAELMRGLVTEPRGHDAVVGAFLLEPESPHAIAQVIFFNNVGTLHMCVHGTIGVAETLRHLGRVESGRHVLETPVGDVAFSLEADGRVAVENVPSRRAGTGVEVETEAHGVVRGDIAWGGNWFFLVDGYEAPISPAHVRTLCDFTSDVRESLVRAGITVSDGLEIDHVEVFGAPTRADAKSKNFVLCPGLAWDRSPCGTGTSAKTACLAAQGSLAEGERFVQESTIGSAFEACYRAASADEIAACTIDGEGPLVVPTIRGRAFMTSEARLLFDEGDPFCNGL